MPAKFLTAEWRKLALANYVLDPKMLQSYIPHGTELDYWNDKCYVSLVGFQFVNTRLKGITIPFHAHFEEVNLRFYVRHKEGGEWKRGVVFIKEIVPKPALTFVANFVYGEKYETMPMKHRVETNDGRLMVEYRWQKNKWHRIRIDASAESIAMNTHSEEEFITEHYWGYTKINETTTSEYPVEHPRWKIYPVKNYEIAVDFGLVYGNQFSFLDNQAPASVFLAEGSEIVVRSGRRIS